MKVDLTDDQWALIRESLGYTKQNFENYTGYPSYEFKQQRIEEVRVILRTISQAKREVRTVGKDTSCKSR